MQLEMLVSSRHLKHGLGYFVKEAGAWRIVYEEDSTAKTRTIRLVLPHKEYENWYRSSEFARTFFLFVR